MNLQPFRIHLLRHFELGLFSASIYDRLSNIHVKRASSAGVVKESDADLRQFGHRRQN